MDAETQKPVVKSLLLAKSNHKYQHICPLFRFLFPSQLWAGACGSLAWVPQRKVSRCLPNCDLITWFSSYGFAFAESQSKVCTKECALLLA